MNFFLAFKKSDRINWSNLSDCQLVTSPVPFTLLNRPASRPASNHWYRQSNRWSSWPDWFLWFLMNRTVEMKILLFVFLPSLAFSFFSLFSLSHNRCPAHFFQPVLSPPHHTPPQNSRCPAHSKTVHKTPQTTPQSLPRSSFSPPQS